MSARTLVYVLAWAGLGLAIAVILFLVYRDALRERRERRKRKPQTDATEAKLRAAYRARKGQNKDD